MRLHDHFSVRQTPQTQPIPGRSDMVQNDAKGWGWELDKWGKLERFITLGTEGGTYYVGEKELTIQNAENVIACIKEDGRRVVERIVEVSEGGKAAKNDYALFALALAMTFGNQSTKEKAYFWLSRVARIGTHLFMFLNYIQSMRGWSRGLRSAVGDWYNEKSPKDLAYQLTKYQQRYGFSHRDALRLAHPKPNTDNQGQLYRWACHGTVDPKCWGYMHHDVAHYLAAANYLLKCNPTANEAIELIEEYRLPREVIPTELLKIPSVWKSLLGEDGQRMPMTALIRNLGNLTKLGVIKPMDDLAQAVASRIADKEAIKKARVHPFSVLTALLTYRSGEGYRGAGTWSPINQIVEALEAAFYNAFENVEPANKRIVYGIDVSGSMTFYGGSVAGVPGLTPAMAAGAMALVCAATEPRFEVWGFDHQLYSLPITRKTSLWEAMSAASRHGGATDASLPMRYAIQQRLEVDSFVLLTDSETWYGPQHPVQAVAEYRRKMGLPAKLVVMAMTANRSTIGDPQDAGILDVVGCSTETPRLVSDFIRG